MVGIIKLLKMGFYILSKSDLTLLKKATVWYCANISPKNEVLHYMFVNKSQGIRVNGECLTEGL